MAFELEDGELVAPFSEYENNRVMRLNLLLLMAVAFLPFPTKLMAEAIRNTNAERAAAIFYGASLLVLTVVLAALWRAVAHRRDLLMPDVSEEEINAIKRAGANRVADGFAATGGPTAAADAIERLLVARNHNSRQLHPCTATGLASH